jgi:hypothetical protein
MHPIGSAGNGGTSPESYEMVNDGPQGLKTVPCRVDLKAPRAPEGRSPSPLGRIKLTQEGRDEGLRSARRVPANG